MKLSNPLLVILLAATGAAAADNDTIGSGCVDPSGFAGCLQLEEQVFIDCGLKCNQTTTVNQKDCLVGCGRVQRGANIGCVVQSCWNKVYSCEYQALALDVIISADLIPRSAVIPFYPPPIGAAGACSCNLGHAYANLTTRQLPGTCNEIARSGTPQALSYCQCCENVRYISSAINVCPDSDLSAIPFDLAVNSAVSAIRGQGFDCAPILNSNSCTTELGIQLFSGSNFYNPLSFPPGVPGSKPLSDVGSFTTFPGPQTTTVSIFGGYAKVITMVPWSAGSGGNGVTAAPSGTGGPGTPGPAATTSTTKSAATRDGNQSAWLLLPLALLVTYLQL